MDLFSRADRTDDATLIVGYGMGDVVAATAFVRRFQGPVHGLAFSITRDPVLAEDVSQEVFVRAWRAAGSFDPRRASVLTWLLTITRNAAIDAIRARRQLPTGEDYLEPLLNATLASDSTEDRALRSVTGGLAVERLRMLPVEQARAVALAVILGCTAAEIGQHEGIPLGTAKTRIRTGLQRLRDLMKADHYE